MTMFSANFSGVAVTAQQDFFELVAPSTGICLIHRCLITQSSDYGDAQAEGLQVLIKRGQTTTGSGGSTLTPQSLGDQGITFAGTVKSNDTTKASVGTIVTVHADSMNEQAGWDFLPTPELRLLCPPSVRMTIELATTPADSLTMSGQLYFEYLGA